MEVKTPFGSAKVSGKIVILVMLILCVVGLSLWHEHSSQARDSQHLEALLAISYVLTLTDIERKQLRLKMPDSLNEKLNRQKGEQNGR